MGEQSRAAEKGSVDFVPPSLCRRVFSRRIAAEAKAAILADVARLNVLSMVARAGSGHLGGSFSSLEILAWLYLQVLSPGTCFSARRDMMPQGTTPFFPLWAKLNSRFYTAFEG